MMLLQILGLVTLIYTIHASGYNDLMSNGLLSDLQLLYKIGQIQKTMPYKIDPVQKGIPIPDYYPDSDDGYNNKMADGWDEAYPDLMDGSSPKEARDYGEAALRDQEYMKQLPITGYQFISGGTGRDEDPSQVKTDKVLPAYCTPPNPCPAGYTGGDNCVKDFENTPDNNRRMLEQQDCPCDAEHMLSCPPGGKTIDPKSGFVNTGDLGGLGSLDMNLSDNPYLGDDLKRDKHVAKKSPRFIRKRETRQKFENIYKLQELINQEQLDAPNPYLDGLPKRVAAKKQAPVRNSK